MHEFSKAEIASLLLSFGQISFKHFSTADELSPQMHDKSFKPEHLEAFSTWETQARRQAGGVATTAVAKAIKAENLTNEAMLKKNVVLIFFVRLDFSGKFT